MSRLLLVVTIGGIGFVLVMPIFLRNPLEPLRTKRFGMHLLRGATGATPSRRGVGFALERRGLLVPVHPNRHVIPTEVAQLVGAEDLSRMLQQRVQ